MKNNDGFDTKKKYIVYMKWQVTPSKQAVKNIKRLPERVKNSLFTLLFEIENKGPVRGNWPNYGKLKGQKHHCHLKKRPANLCGCLAGC